MSSKKVGLTRVAGGGRRESGQIELHVLPHPPTPLIVIDSGRARAHRDFSRTFSFEKRSSGRVYGFQREFLSAGRSGPDPGWTPSLALPSSYAQIVRAVRFAPTPEFNRHAYLLPLPPCYYEGYKVRLKVAPPKLPLNAGGGGGSGLFFENRADRCFQEYMSLKLTRIEGES